MQLRNRIFLLLGGTGGIGQALVKPLVEEGATLIIASRHPETVASGPVTTTYLDLAAANLEQQLVGLSERFPDIDGVIHCAGSNHFAAIGQSPVSAIDDQIAVNLRSPLIIARHFAPRFSQSGSGALVFVGSTFGSIGFPGYTAYCATKFGLRGFSEALRRELADTGVQVMYVAPRATATAMNPASVNAMNKALGNAMDTPEAVAGQILQAMKKDQKRHYLGWPEKLFVAINSIMPRLVDNAMLKQLPVIRRFLKSGAIQ